MVKKLSVFFLAMFFAAQLFAAEKKNVIFIVADGGGPTLMGFLMQYARYAPNSPYKGELSNLEKVYNDSTIGVLFNTPTQTIVTDSAQAGTQMATGAITYPDALGVNSAKEPVESLLIKAQKKGMATGLITDVYVIDATPGSFVANEESRKNYESIAQSMLKVKPDVVLGGGLNYFISKEVLTKYENVLLKVPYKDSLKPKLKSDTVFEQLLKSGYQIVFHKKDLEKAKGPKLFGLFAPEYLPFNIETKPSYPTLTDMSKKAIEILSKNNNGFFLMLEAGLLDWAAHNNDQGAVLHELLELDAALGYLTGWIKENPNTLLVITADHDTGGFGFHYRKTKGQEFEEKISSSYTLYKETDYVAKSNLDIIASQNMSNFELKNKYKKLAKKDQTPQMMQKLIKDHMSYDLSLETIEDLEDFDKVIDEVAKRLGVVWATGNHTASPLFVTFYGAKDGIKGGVMTGADLNKKIEEFLYAD